MATLAKLQERLAACVQAQDDAVETGAQYAFTGSHSATNHSLDQLVKQEKRLRSRILRFRGVQGHSMNNHSLSTEATAPAGS